MSVPVTSPDKCGGGVRDARVAEGADFAVQRPAPPGTADRRHPPACRHESRTRGDGIGAPGPIDPHSFEHGERRRTKGGPVSINRELVTAAMSALSPAAGVGEDLIAGTGNTPPAPAIATGSRGRSADHRRVNLRCCARMAGRRRVSRATWRHRRRVHRRRARRPLPTSWRRLEEVYEAPSEPCSVIRQDPRHWDAGASAPAALTSPPRIAEQAA